MLASSGKYWNLEMDMKWDCYKGCILDLGSSNFFSFSTQLRLSMEFILLINVNLVKMPTIVYEQEKRVALMI